MSIYDRMRATASRMLDTVSLAGMGQTITISSRGTSTYTVATGAASYTTTTQTGSGVLLEQDVRDANGVLIQRGDKRLLLSPLNSSGAALTAPKVGDTVAIDSVTYRIEGVKTTAPAGTVVMYDCDLRGTS